jgi:hypothetical protein
MKNSEGHRVCPSGLIVEVRGLKTKEANLLTNKQAVKAGTVLDQILDACWLRTVDAGPYDFGEGKPDWGKLHVGDRIYILIQIRIETFGATYAFDVRCLEENCGAKIQWELDLDDLDVRPIPPSVLEAMKAGRPLTVVVAGKSVQFKVMRGEDERKNARVMRANPDTLLLNALAARITGIEGLTPKDKLAWLEDLPLGEATHILDLLDEQDGGVQTDIEIRCPECGSVQDQRLPFGPRFLLPRKPRTALPSETS